MKVYLAMPKDSSVTKSFFPEDLLKKLEELFEVVYFYGDSQPKEEDFAIFAKDCDAVITGWGHPRITEKMLKDTKVKVIAHVGGSVGSLVGDDVYDLGIRVISGNLLFAQSVAEGVISYMLLGRRRHPDYIDAVKRGGWFPPCGYNTKGLIGESVGLVGFGTITKFLIEMLKPFKVDIKLYSSYPPDEEYCKKYNITVASLEDIFKSCSIVSVHSALCERTKGLIGKEHFDLLRDGALFINTSRGRVIREDQMIDALKTGRFDAVLDVYYNEPLDEDSPLRTLENVYALPHVAGPTFDRRPLIAQAVIDSIPKLLQGESSELEITRSAAARMTITS